MKTFSLEDGKYDLFISNDMKTIVVFNVLEYGRPSLGDSVLVSGDSYKVVGIDYFRNSFNQPTKNVGCKLIRSRQYED